MAKSTGNKGKATKNTTELVEAEGVEEQGLPQIKLRRLETMRFTIPVVGVTPLIIHQWSEKAKREMLEKGGPAAPRKQKEKRDPEADYQSARYLLDQPREDGLTDGITAVSFKAAIVQAARAFDGVTMTALKQFIYVEGEPPKMLIPIIGKPQMREDMVRVGKGLNKTADLRWRPEYWPWKVNLVVRWPAAVIDIDSVVSLIDAAGQGGVGEWRPTAPQSMTGIYGQFRIDFNEEIRREEG